MYVLKEKRIKYKVKKKIKQHPSCSNLTDKIQMQNIRWKIQTKKKYQETDLKEIYS